MRSKTKSVIKRFAKQLASDYQLPTHVYYKDKTVVRDRTFVDEDGVSSVVPVSFSIRELGMSERGVYQYVKKLYKRFHGDWNAIFKHLNKEAINHESK